jgi:phosphoglucomutase
VKEDDRPISAADEYRRWTEYDDLAPELRAELEAIAGNEAEIADRFWRHLAFGTGGLRGVMGAGTNRMNIHTVARATQGLADYLRESGGASVCIAYDTRRGSRAFAQMAAEVLCGNGIRTFLFGDTRPTPMLSFAVRQKKASAGIVITASHNPKEYNGYKVYGPDGGQITDKTAAAILLRIGAYEAPGAAKRLSLNEARASGLLCDLDDVDEAYYEKVKSLILRPALLRERARDLKILYTPLHGSGNIPVRRILRELGFSDVETVSEQELPDGDFPTVPYPNPENPAVFDLAIARAKETAPDLIFATDPDCDRIGVLARDGTGGFFVLSGNQTGALLCDYILSTRASCGALRENAAVVKTIVTTEFVRAVCESYGVALIDTLTGFKYIGEKIGEWERTGAHTFVFGFEESYGYLAGDFVRDKDAVIAAALIAEMTLYHKSEGRSLAAALEALYARYGFADERLLSVSMEGEAGLNRIAAILEDFRARGAGAFPGEDVVAVEDYETSLRRDARTGAEEKIPLPRSDALKFLFADKSWMALRPSGTEPKIKIYIGASGASKQEVAARLAVLERLASGIVAL